jgi:SAM-dependent methyltransferase
MPHLDFDIMKRKLNPVAEVASAAPAPPPKKLSGMRLKGTARRRASAESSSAAAVHKKRQRERKQEEKQESLDRLLGKIAQKTAITDLAEQLPRCFEPIPCACTKHANGHQPEAYGCARCQGEMGTREMSTSEIGTSDCSYDWYWDVIPPLCTPDGGEGSLKEVSAWQESKRQKKFEKKFRKQFEEGDITQAEMEAKLAKHRRTGNSGHAGDGMETFSLLSADRNKRKRQQVQNFASLLMRHRKLGREQFGTPNPAKTSPRKLIVDFGCGTGNLCLSLAASPIFRERPSSSDATEDEQPEYSFLFTDRNAGSLEILKKRAQKSGLVEGLVGAGANVGFIQHSFNISDFAANTAEFWRKVEQKYGVDLVVQGGETGNADGSAKASDKTHGVSHALEFDLGIGLHCCGSFTDMVMEVCRRKAASCIVCPCCNGKMHVDKLRSREQHASGGATGNGGAGGAGGAGEGATGGAGGAGAEAGGSKEGQEEQDGGEPFRYPRSNYFKHRLEVTEEEYLQQLSRAADDLGNYSCKCLIELDRALWAMEDSSLTHNSSVNVGANADPSSENTLVKADTFVHKILQKPQQHSDAGRDANGRDANGHVPVDLLRLAPTECSPKHHVIYVRQWQ